MSKNDDKYPIATREATDVQAQFQTGSPAARSAKDTHVAACAHCLIATNAYPDTSPIALVTRNTKDFKKTALAGLGIALMKPDDFLDGLTATQPQDVAAAFRRFRLDLTSQPEHEALLERLDRDGLVKTVQRLQALHQAGTVQL